MRFSSFQFQVDFIFMVAVHIQFIALNVMLDENSNWV